MDSLFDGKWDIKTASRYRVDYDTLTKDGNLKTADIYFLCLILGYLNGEKVASQDAGGKEFRPSYFNSLQKSLLYGFVLNLPEVNVEDMTDGKKIMSIYGEVSAYANGGIEWLRREIFSDQLSNDGEIEAEPVTVIERLSQMIHDQLDPETTPF